MDAVDLPLQALRRLQIEPLIAYRSEVPGWARDLTSTHAFFTWWRVERGHVSLEWARSRCTIGPGQAVLIPPGLRRHHCMEPGTRLCSVSFWAGWDDGRPLLRLETPLTGGCPGGGPLSRAGNRLCRWVSSAPGRPAHLSEVRCVPELWLRIRVAVDAFVFEMVRWSAPLGAPVAIPGEGDPRLNQVLSEIRANLRAGPLPYARWGAQTSLGKAQLDRLAHRWLGASLRHRRDELLLAEILRALARREESLKQIASRLGFFDAAHFTRWVKRHAGRVPRDLRGAWV